ncbi:MAG: aminotransferase class IV, partial [Xanthomonadaceae bacterium]|nr:aminotransferase class IV [Xanthomonadaceae bacterium]
DPHGHIASCNATNFFWVVNSEMHTSTGEFCFNGITRDNVIGLCRATDIPIRLADFAPADVTKADEAFVTGTFGGLTPVREIDGRVLPASLPGPMTKRLRELYDALKEKDAAS